MPEPDSAGAARHDATLMWFRRDLRISDNAALHAALTQGRKVYCAFVFDRSILDALPSRADRRVEFIHGSVAELDSRLRQAGGALIVVHGHAGSAIPRLARELGVGAVYANRDYEPVAKARDSAVENTLREHGILFALRKDQVIFEQDEVLTAAGQPFSVFTPYRNAWLRHLESNESFWVRPYPVERYLKRLAPTKRASALPALSALGFESTNLATLGIVPGMSGASRRFDDFQRRIARYHEARDYPAIKGPSYLSVHLRFGTISIRQLVAFARARAGAGRAVWLNELIWREFYFAVLDHHPHVAVRSFKPAFANIPYPDDPDKYAAWCDGRTGYPIVDAAMRQLNATGYMHNRLRMIAASFLVKDLHCDWRLGERYFAAQLLDFDLAANNGGWQWSASTGCDAQPYFRIFNPVTQSRHFDPDGRFIRKYVPELARVSGKFIHAPWTMDAEMQRTTGVRIGHDYPAPIVDHAAAREVALRLYGKAG